MTDSVVVRVKPGSHKGPLVEVGPNGELNIKDPEVDRLAAELADRLHTSKTAAIRHALSAQLAFLESRAGDREAQLLDILRTEIWPLLADRSPITKLEREQILGYDPATGV